MLNNIGLPGLLLIAVVVLVLFGPMYMFSSLNPALESNPVIGSTLTLSLTAEHAGTTRSFDLFSGHVVRNRRVSPSSHHRFCTEFAPGCIRTLDPAHPLTPRVNCPYSTTSSAPGLCAAPSATP